MSLVTIIVVNWNAGSQLADVINSIAEHHEHLVSSVVVVDNASTDDSIALALALKNLPFRFEIIRNEENQGFASACNQGAAMAATPYLLFLNPDTRLFVHSLSKPLAFMEDNAHQKVGVCGIQLIDENGSVARSCARFPTWQTFLLQSVGLNKLPWFRQFSLHRVDWDHASTQTVDHVIGAFFLVRRSLFNVLKGFDQRFFVYLEDLDFSRRLSLLGYSSVYLTGVQAFHAGGGTSRQIKATRLFYALRSRLLYGFKHFSPFAAWMLLLLTIVLEPFSRIVFSLVLGHGQECIHTLQGYRLLIEHLPVIIRVATK